MRGVGPGAATRIEDAGCDYNDKYLVPGIPPDEGASIELIKKEKTPRKTEPAARA